VPGVVVSAALGTLPASKSVSNRIGPAMDWPGRMSIRPACSAIRAREVSTMSRVDAHFSPSISAVCWSSLAALVSMARAAPWASCRPRAFVWRREYQPRAHSGTSTTTRRKHSSLDLMRMDRSRYGVAVIASPAEAVWPVVRWRASGNARSDQSWDFKALSVSI